MADSPIEYPKLTIPGRGEVTVRFSGRAIYVLENDLQMDQPAIAAKLRVCFPHEEDGVTVSGRVSPVFLFKVLAACVWKDLHMAPEDLADLFEPGDFGAVARVVIEAFSKARWLPATSLHEAATDQGQVQ